MTQSATLNARGFALLQNVEFIDNGDIRPGWLSSDGTIVYGIGADLRISRDDGHTWTAAGATHFVATLAANGVNVTSQPYPPVHGVRETADGELLISVYTGQGWYNALWRSTGWQAFLGNGTAPSWTEVLSPSGGVPVSGSPSALQMPFPAGATIDGLTPDKSNYFSSPFGFHCYGNGWVIVNEYGKQANGTSVCGARCVFLSKDNGKPGTWVLVRDFWSGPPYTTPGNTLTYGLTTSHDHIHSAAYDPYTGLVWFTGGDNGFHTEYADTADPNWPDPGNVHGTWKQIPGNSPYLASLPGSSFLNLLPAGGQPGTTQAASAWPTPERILFGSDGQIDGVASYEKIGAQAGVTLAAHGIHLPHSSSLNYSPSTIYQRDVLSLSPTYKPIYPTLFPFYNNNPAATMPSVLVACDPLARRFYDVFVDTVNVSQPGGVRMAIGPTARGKLLAAIALDGRSANQVSDVSGYTFMRADFPVIL